MVTIDHLHLLHKDVKSIEYEVAKEKVRFGRFRPFPFWKRVSDSFMTVMFENNKADSRFRLIFPVEENGILLREFLQGKGISKRTLTATKYEGGKLTVNGIERNVRHPLRSGDEVEIIFPPEETSAGLLAEEGQLDIVYEDEAIIIINKPPGQSTIPSRDHPTGTIANFVAGKFARERIPATVHVVTRLDRDTSGLICIAQNRHIHHLLGQQMINSGFYRQYEAVVEGHIQDVTFTIKEPIGRKDGTLLSVQSEKMGSTLVQTCMCSVILRKRETF